MSYLMTLIDVRKDLVNAVNRIDAYETLCVRMEWGTEDTSDKQTGAFNTVCARVLSAANRLALMPEERDKLVTLLRQERIRSEGLAQTNERLRAENQRLTEANVMMVQGRPGRAA